jgi:uncharacterized protein with HEPN domain
MAQHDDATRLRHMLDHAREAVHFAGGKRRADLDQDRLLTLALTRLLEIIGEAAARVTETTRTRHPQIPWPQITGLRNRLIHGYDQINLDILWQVVSSDLPPLIADLDAILKNP